ncbi:MAG: alanine--tRNA ligase [Bryobacterales bacterium]|nr:alanine--tRNA ligase [Bryobacterales bacterium]MBV9400225.1 alanine--tRNA ligase [Bryobacterales bacterium]
MTGSQIRQKFLDYFASRGHRVVRSSSLVPANDPTLLFTNAGMNQFKDVFLGLEKRDYTRAASSQKCVRAGGKHNDLDNVGYTRRHHTFFEMLGNFSFGDYFKREAIGFAWELITKEYGLAKDRLYVTVFREDDDAEKLWQEVAGVPKDRIFRLDEKDNFWQMGETGPCGPCSEIHYDFGPEGGPGTFPDNPGERFVEIWNLVFMQYDRDSSGNMTPLPRPSIDTGMGLERIAAVLQGKLSNYETDLLRPIIDKAGELFRKTYGEDDRGDTVLRINADHARATAFLINDGVLPSNDGRGYVLRKIMRRAMRNARMIGVNEPYLYRLTGFIAELMSDAYPDMLESIQRVARVVKDEEHRYATTFQVAERFFQDEAKAAANGLLPGAAAFKLYDTYGLALDEQEEMAREAGLTIDREGFTAEMEKQRARARASWKGGEKAQINPVYQALPKTGFVGRETLEAEANVVAVLDNEIALDRTPFYAEAGGQVGDTGVLISKQTGDVIAHVLSAYSPAPGKTVHKLAPGPWPPAPGDVVIARVDPESRHSTMRNHTGTHLLHAALRKVLGMHVKQAGSVVEPSRLRFDFSHYTAMDPDEIAEVERLMNEEILANIEVHTDIMDLDHALKTGAMALFGEKYGDQVRVVSIESFSKELCGGTHVARTGDIGICKIVYEGSISAGVRRIEAITGEGALKKFQEIQEQAERYAGVDVEKLQNQVKSLEHELQQIKTRMAQAEAGQLENKARELKGVKVLAARVEGFDRAQLRTLVDSLRNRWKTAVVVLATAEDSNVAIVSGVTKDLTSKVHAGKLAGAVAQAVGGKGGGRPDMAEAGGKDPSALAGALAQVYTSVEGML